MLNAYETHLLNTYLVNIASKIDSRSPEAEDFIEWVTTEWNKFACDSENAGVTSRQRRSRVAREIMRLDNRSRDRNEPVSAKALNSVRESLLATLPARPPRPDRTAKRLRQLGKATGLSTLDREVLELMLRCATSHGFDSLIDDVFDRPGPRMDRLHVSGYVVSMLLGRRPRSIQSRFGVDSPLVRSGLVQIDRDGDLEVPRWLYRLANEPGNNTKDIMQILFDSASASELEWSDFDHVAKHRDHIETLVKGAMQNRSKGVNILLYGPPGTGKTEFCDEVRELAREFDATPALAAGATVAARIGDGNLDTVRFGVHSLSRLLGCNKLCRPARRGDPETLHLQDCTGLPDCGTGSTRVRQVLLA